MKKLSIALLLGCFLGVNAAQAFEPYQAGIYTKTTQPAAETPNVAKGSKVGEATCRSVMGIVNWGDCSFKTAMKNGKITKATGADWEHFWVIVYGKKTYRVYGD